METFALYGYLTLFSQLILDVLLVGAVIILAICAVQLHQLKNIVQDANDDITELVVDYKKRKKLEEK